METRELFWSLETPTIILFYVAGFAAIGVFVWGCWRHYAKYARGARLRVPLDIGAGARRMVSDLLSHRTLVRRDHYAGAAHAGIFFGFLLAAIGTATITLEYDFLDPLFGITFWKGDFYLWFSLVLDIGHFGLTVGIVMMMVRRAVFDLAKLDYRRSYRGESDLRPAAAGWRIEDWAFLCVLLAIEITGFLQEGVRLLMDQPAWAAWSPVGYALANIFAASGMTPETTAAIRGANWWLHGLLALAFTGAIPWYKAKHILAVVGSLALRDRKALRRLPREEDGGETVGVASVADFSWKDMLNFDACTKCGRCHEVCPARAVGYPLSPRDLILDLRLHNDKAQGRPLAGVDLIGDVIEPETLWACRSCGACQEICPVGIEHPSIIIEMRRQLVERGDMDPLLQATLDTIGNTGNSFGENARKRAAWARDLEFEIKDIRQEPAEVLWFVGDYASFDPRNQKVSRTVARLLKAAGVDFALLHEGEHTAGNDVRRVGEEGLYQNLVEHNLEQMTGGRKFSTIITTDPHSYNTIKNEYPEFGEVAPIQHYSTVLAELLRAGRLKVVKPLGKRITFHDPCHLGRLNGGYEAPREVLQAIGCDLVEMPRNRDNSFCCGAGGGRIWIPDPPGMEKPSENRVREAAALGGIDVFVTCCPKDLTMFEDARKTSGHEKDFVVEDLAELVAEAIELKSISLQDVPSLAERITDTVAERIAKVVAGRIDEVLAARLGQMAAPPAPPTAAEAPATPGPSDAGLPASPAVEPSEAEPAAALPEVPTPRGPAERRLAEMDWDNLLPVLPPDLAPYERPAKEGVRILVAVKHVAVLGDEYDFTEDGRDIRPEFLEYALNEWDDAALEEALLTVERLGGGEVVAVTVGPEDAESTLRKVLAKGADRAVRVWDDRLLGADPVTVARAIAGVAVQEDPNLILAGVQSGDHAHGATGTALARILGLPHAAVVVEIDWDGKADLKLVRELEGGMRHSFELPGPAVVTVQTGINTPRYATMRMIKQAKKKPLAVLDGAPVLDGGGGYVVRRMYLPERSKAEMLEGSAEEVAAMIADIIRERRGD
ncbi:MAG: heterodisulfide reductase-related iron-sulfur binding cluster [Kiloniellaceae bacterium]